ncbi:hypothetical protein GCM10023339_37170 [Alloalcanivorax gelatiniphagus]
MLALEAAYRPVAAAQQGDATGLHGVGFAAAHPRHFEIGKIGKQGHGSRRRLKKETTLRAPAGLIK